MVPYSGYGPRFAVALTFAIFLTPAQALDVKITSELASVRVLHEGEWITVMRNQNRQNRVNPAFALTSRECPEHCIQPAVAARGVETVGELEVLSYLVRQSEGDDSVLVIDSRTQEWVRRGTIPGAVNIPWDILAAPFGGGPALEHLLVRQFGAVRSGGDAWDYSRGKTLVLFCNGIWCDQSLRMIRVLLELGYPAEKLKWYRGGMQDWELVGLTTVTPPAYGQR